MSKPYDKLLNRGVKIEDTDEVGIRFLKREQQDREAKKQAREELGRVLSEEMDIPLNDDLPGVDR